MNKKNKLITGGLSLVLGALMLSGCTRSFCTINDQAHIMYMFDYGVTEYYDSNVEGSVKYNDNIFIKYTPLDKISDKSGIGSANNAAKQSGAPIPSLDYWIAVDTVVLNNALSKSQYNKSTVTYSELIKSLENIGKHIHVVFASFRDKNIDLMLNALGSISSDITITTFNHKRARTEDDYFLYLADYKFEEDYISLINTLTSTYPDDLILVTGSLDFVGKVRKQFVK